MVPPSTTRPRRAARSTVAALAVVGGLVVTGCDDETADEIDPDLDASFPAVPRDTVESPALSETVPDVGSEPPFGTVAIEGEVRAVDRFAEDGGDFDACRVGDDRVDVAAMTDAGMFAFQVFEDTPSVALDDATTTDITWEREGTSVRGDADVDGVEVEWDITC